MDNRDAVIIGGGSAGYAAAIRVSQLGGKATIVEKDALGGTCLNRGCIPTRLLARVAEFIEMSAHGKDYGITFNDPVIDFPKLISRKEVVVKTLVGGIRMLLTSNGVEMLEGTATLTRAGEVALTAPDGTRKTLSARNVVIATGAVCKTISVPGGERVINTTEALQLNEIPESMTILGAGFIGMSLAAVFSRLGSRVTVMESSSRMLKEIDAEIASQYEKEAKKSKIKYYPECRILRIEEGARGELNIIAETKGQEVVANSRYVVNAEEREAAIGGLGLEVLGITLNENKGLAVDSRMETNIPGVFAAGDVTMQYMWTNVAYMEGIVAAENAMNRKSKINYTAIPYWANTIPGIAGCGMTEEKAIADGYAVKVGRFFFAGNGMSTILGQRTGMVKVIIDEKYGQILGVHMLGPQAVELIAEAAMAIKLELTPEDIGGVFHVHPSTAEALWETARGFTGEAIHIPPSK